MTLPLSVVVAVRDEEEQLAGCLASIAGLTDDIIVVLDPRTRDGSASVAAAFDATIVEREFDGLGPQRNAGLDCCRNSWVLVLDADERVSPTLAASVATATASALFPAYAFSRGNIVLGLEVRHGDWGGDRVVRLIDRNEARFSDDPVHPVAAATRTGYLRGTLEHHTFRSLEQYLPKLVDYALRGAADLAGRGRRGGVWRAALRAGWRFVRAYLIRGGVLDGRRGLLVASLSAAGCFLKWTAVWSRTHEP